MRTALAIASVVLTVVGFVSGLGIILTKPGVDVLDSLPFNEMLKIAVEIRINQSTMLINLVLAIAVGLVGLFIAKPGELRLLLTDWQEILMSACALIFLAGSAFMHYLYIDFVQTAYYSAGIIFGQTQGKTPTIPDVFALGVSRLLTCQIVLFFFGFTISVLTFASAHRLRK